MNILLILFRQLDVHLLEKMRLNCQVFKDEISVVHLNRQVAHLQNALQEADMKVLRNEFARLTHAGTYLNVCKTEAPAD